MTGRASRSASTASSATARSLRSSTPMAISRCWNGPPPARGHGSWESCITPMKSGNMPTTENPMSASWTRRGTRRPSAGGPWSTWQRTGRWSTHSKSDDRQQAGLVIAMKLVHGVAGAVVLLSTSLETAAVAQQQPNIIYFQVDNLGFGELGTYGGGVLRGSPTRNIDQL